uniref:Uncharacterized protein n=1 Tax=Noccaea caerulescens TaxID=107243 RepID=A0A1J3F9D1_NOCCA
MRLNVDQNLLSQITSTHHLLKHMSYCEIQGSESVMALSLTELGGTDAHVRLSTGFRSTDCIECNELEVVW